MYHGTAVGSRIPTLPKSCRGPKKTVCCACVGRQACTAEENRALLCHSFGHHPTPHAVSGLASALPGIGLAAHTIPARLSPQIHRTKR